jgi:hypothetical protein
MPWRLVQAVILLGLLRAVRTELQRSPASSLLEAGRYPSPEAHTRALTGS